MNSEIAAKRKSQVIRVDTVTTSRADFLATHVPFKKIQVMDKFDNVSAIKDEMTEEQVYQKLARNPKNEHQFIVVIGSSGAGKSHFIRWIDARLSQEVLENEVVMFIRRSDNSLKGTIKQLLEIKEIAELPNKEVYERLVRAGTNITDKKLKDMIYQNFIVEIRNEDSEILSRIEKKRFLALLSNDDFRSCLMEEGKAIDRIYAKVAENVVVENRDVIALFDINDIEVDNELLDKMENSADRNAYKMVLSLNTDKELVEKCVILMNTLVDKVIQTCAGLEPGDFDQIFTEIRKELKRQEKNLTLLIEDITAFTGVNVGLLNVLTTEATGDYEEDGLCRITSIVGTTEVYYNTRFQDNHRSRVTKFVMIPNDIFRDDSVELYRFVARYLNTISLPADIVERWAKNGNLDSEYPVHEVVEGKEWDYVELPSGQSLCLYPFTKQAILNLYKCILQPDYRTPRNLLNDVVEKTITDILKNRENFPQFRIPNIPMFKPIEHGHYISNYTEQEGYERLRKFICVWGDANVWETKVNGVAYIGGIKKDIYTELGFPAFDGIPNGKSNLVTNVSEQRTKSTEEDITNQNVKTVVKSVKEISQEEKDYQTGIELIHKWMEGMKLNIGATVGGVGLLTKTRDAMNNYLYSVINWQVHNVSLDNIFKIKGQSKKKLIGFEGQMKGLNDVYLVLESSRETQRIIECFLAYVTLGKQSWNFEGAPMMLYNIERWTEKIKDKIVGAVSTFEEGAVDYSEYAIAAELYRLVLFGVYKGTSVDSMSGELVLDAKNIKNVTDNCHSKKWNELMNFMKQGERDKFNKDTIRQYFNLIQGDGKAAHIYLEQTGFAETLKKVKKSKVTFSKEEMQRVDPVTPRREVREYFKSVLDRIGSVCEAELEQANSNIQKISEYFNNVLDLQEDDIEDFAYDVAKFYDEANKTKIPIRYDSDLVANIKNSAKGLEGAIEKIKKAKDKENGIEKLMLFSQDPIRKISYFLSLVERVKSDIDTANKNIEKRKEKLGTANSGAGSNDRFIAESTMLKQMSTLLVDMEVGR